MGMARTVAAVFGAVYLLAGIVGSYPVARRSGCSR